MRNYLPKSVATAQEHLNQTRKMQDPHKYPYQPQLNPATQKQILYFKQLWIKEESTHTKQAVLLSHTSREKICVHAIL